MRRLLSDPVHAWTLAVVLLLVLTFEVAYRVPPDPVETRINACARGCQSQRAQFQSYSDANGCLCVREFVGPVR